MKKPTNATVLFPLLCSDLPWIPPTLWTPLGSPFLPVPDAPAQDLPCPSTRKTLVWASLFWIPARVPFCHLLPLPRDFLVLVFFFTGLDIWTPVLDFPVLAPCPGFPLFFTCSMTTSSPLCGRPFFYLSLVACRLLQVGHVPAMRATTGKGGQ